MPNNVWMKWRTATLSLIVLRGHLGMVAKRSDAVRLLSSTLHYSQREARYILRFLKEAGLIDDDGFTVQVTVKGEATVARLLGRL
ncbi:MAG: hypothetical protein QXG48_06145 [Thermofilaceae archaeon]